MLSERPQVFSTSIRVPLRLGVTSGTLVFAVALGIFYFVSGDTLERTEITISLFAWLCTAVLPVLEYLLFGVKSVTLSSRAIALAYQSGSEYEYAWSSFTNFWNDDKWRFEHPGGRIILRDSGFTSDQWWELSRAIDKIEASLPLESTPGVTFLEDASHQINNEDVPSATPLIDTPKVTAFERALTQQPPKDEHAANQAIMYEAHQPGFFSGGEFLFWIGALITIPNSYVRYVNGTWHEEPTLTLFLPVFCVGLSIAWPFLMRRQIKCVRFDETHMVLERIKGRSFELLYSDITDHFGAVLVAKGKRFFLGRNSKVFGRLLYPRLQEGQISGELFMKRIHDLSMTSILLSFLSIPMAIIGAFWLDVPAHWFEVTLIGAMMVTGSIASLTLWIIRKWKRSTRGF